MPARRNGDQWRYRKWVGLRDGRRVRISGTPSINTRQAAEASERAHIERLWNPVVPEKKEVDVPRFYEFAEQFLAVAAMHNKPSTQQDKASILRHHLTPSFGSKRLNDISYAAIQDYAAAKAKKLAKKTVNNHLTVLRRLLVVAKKRGVIQAVPEIEWLKAPDPEFDFLDFEEAERLLAGSDGEWRTMILVALRTGMRQGEILALRWEDVDLVKGQLSVRRSVTREIITTPKSGRSRDIPLGDEVLAALKAHRHLRGQLVFCTDYGRMLKKNEVKHPLWRATKKAGLRHIGWHTLRHTFASHLSMQGVPLKAVQELLGHATIEMTMRYAHLSPHVPRDAVKLLDHGGRFGNGWAKTEKTILTV
jgi:integrase